MRRAPRIRDMVPWVRVLLWTAVVVAPGGVLLVPFLAADELRRRGQVKADTVVTDR